MNQLSVATSAAGFTALVVGTSTFATAWAQDSPVRAPWEMVHQESSNSSWLMPLVMVAWFAIIVVVIILMVRLLRDQDAGRSASTRAAHRILDQRCARRN